MPSANTPPPDAPDSVIDPPGLGPSYQIKGTGTTNDGRWVNGTITIDPATGLPLVWSGIGGGSGGSVTVNNTASVPVPIAGAVTVTSSPTSPVYINPPVAAPIVPAATTVTSGQDNTVALGQQCRTFTIVNYTAYNVNYNLDAAAGVGTLCIPPAQVVGGITIPSIASSDMVVTVLHLWPQGGGTIQLNNASTAGIFVQAGA